MFYGLATHEEEFAKHLNLFVAFNPVTKIPNAAFDLRIIADNYYELAWLAKAGVLNSVGMSMNFLEK
jgi:hypothetical protein